MTSICLNMIVKNEGHIIRQTLSNLCEHIPFSYWVISDTGSTDNTISEIVKFFNEMDIPGEIFQDQWKDFSFNRNLAIDHAKGKGEYLFVFDADDRIEGKMDFNSTPLLLDDMYYGKLQHGNMTHHRIVLFKNNGEFHYEGIIHEVICCDNPTAKRGYIGGNYHIAPNSVVSHRNKDPKKKYINDAQILAVEYGLEGKEWLKNRYAFYCAQSFRDAGCIDEAIKWYEVVLTLKSSWSQEKYVAAFHLGHLYMTKNSPGMALYYWTQTVNYDSERIEGIVEICSYYRRTDQHKLCEMYYREFKNYKPAKILEKEGKLFLLLSYYDQALEFNYSISGFYTGQMKDAYRCCKEIIFSAKRPICELGATLNNLRFFLPIAKNDPKKELLLKSISKIYCEHNELLTNELAIFIEEIMK